MTAVPANNEEQQRADTNITLPNVLFVGAQKAGTSAIAYWLSHKNGVCLANVLKGEPDYFNKEVHFFNRYDRFSKGLEFYAKHFEHCQNKALAMDATPDYLNWASRIHSFYEAAGEHRLENLKIMVSLRDPIARELSIYNHMLDLYLENPDPDRTKPCKGWYVQIGRPDGSIMSFDEYVDAVVIPNLKNPWKNNFSMYAKYLKEWFQLFDRNNLLVLSYDELKTNSNKTKWRVKEFLGHDEFHGTFEKTNTKSFSGKVALPSCKAQEKLKNVFDPLNEDLYELLDSYMGPSMEQRPFPRFPVGECNINSTRHYA
jgi:hypothetical protein